MRVGGKQPPGPTTEKSVHPPIDITLVKRSRNKHREASPFPSTTQPLLMMFSAASFFIVLYYLPVYFQSVGGVSAADSGVRNIPFIIGVGLFSILTGFFIGATGHYSGALVLGSMLIMVGAGLMLKLDVDSPSSAWIGYQVAIGIGSGMVIQAPIIVAQASVAPPDMSNVSAIILCFQTASGAVFIAVAQALFTNRIIKQTATDLPELDPARVVATGATELRSVFSASRLHKFLDVYLAGLREGYLLAITCGGVALVLAMAVLVFDNRNLKRERKVAELAAQDEASPDVEGAAHTSEKGSEKEGSRKSEDETRCKLPSA